MIVPLVRVKPGQKIEAAHINALQDQLRRNKVVSVLNGRVSETPLGTQIEVAPQASAGGKMTVITAAGPTYTNYPVTADIVSFLQGAFASVSPVDGTLVVGTRAHYYVTKANYATQDYIWRMNVAIGSVTYGAVNLGPNALW